MFFLLRCGFWLSIVFYSMPWPQSPGQPSGFRDNAIELATSAAGELASATAKAVKTNLEDKCVKHLAECMATAQKLAVLANGPEVQGPPAPPSLALAAPAPMQKRSAPSGVAEQGHMVASRKAQQARN